MTKMLKWMMWRPRTIDSYLAERTDGPYLASCRCRPVAAAATVVLVSRSFSAQCTCV